MAAAASTPCACQDDAVTPLRLLHSVCSSMRGRASTRVDENEHWLALSILCPEALAGAAEILDQKSIVQCIARDSRRVFHSVESAGGREKPHTCIPGFCTCKFYSINIASKPDALVCKHELAILLADALGLSLQREVDDAAWSEEFSRATALAMAQFGAREDGML